MYCKTRLRCGVMLELALNQRIWRDRTATFDSNASTESEVRLVLVVCADHASIEHSVLGVQCWGFTPHPGH